MTVRFQFFGPARNTAAPAAAYLEEVGVDDDGEELDGEVGQLGVDEEEDVGGVGAEVDEEGAHELDLLGGEEAVGVAEVLGEAGDPAEDGDEGLRLARDRARLLEGAVAAVDEWLEVL